MVEQHCSNKVRHENRRAAAAALNNTLDGRRELMAPYPCKFCFGWHNGHDPIAGLREWEPRCPRCGHNAIVHDTHRGMGCMDCDCLASRDWVYRWAIQQAHARIDQAKRQRKNAERVVRIVFSMLPHAFAGFIKVKLRRKMRGEADKG